MKESERIIVTSIFATLIFAWLGFLIHTSTRFAGSGIGAVFGISGAVLMLLPFLYVAIKRIPFIREHVSKYLPIQKALSLHVYLGIIGALLALIHTGHNYHSVLGIALTATVLLLVVGGFAVRYLLAYVSRDIKDKLSLLQTARGDLDNAWGVLESTPSPAPVRPASPWWAASGLAFAGAHGLATPVARITVLAEYVADLEYSVRAHEFLKRWFARALIAHIVLSIVLCVLLAGHIASGIYFGLRWLR